MKRQRLVNANFARLSMSLIVAICNRCDDDTIAQIIEDLPADLRPEIRELVAGQRRRGEAPDERGVVVNPNQEESRDR